DSGSQLTSICCQSGKVPLTILAFSPNNVRVRVDAPSDLFMVSNDNYDCFWSATVDGARVRLSRQLHLQSHSSACRRARSRMALQPLAGQNDVAVVLCNPGDVQRRLAFMVSAFVFPARCLAMLVRHHIADDLMAPRGLLGGGS